MRNLKRVLSLGLASVMLLGMMVMGAGAASKDFTDASEIKNAEAVNVLTALGVMEGTDKGAFNPKGTLTREQAAKIIAVMLLGEDADKIATNSVSFKDVAANRWSAGYIGYCAQAGILAGDGTGNFNPEGELTGLSFAKMLLVALGYDPAIEQYVGKDWAINVAADAVDAGISPNGLVLANTLTREDAAQMAFQALTADMVRYANKGSEITTGNGDKIVIGFTPAEPVAGTGKDYANRDDNKVMEFCERYFTDLKKVAGEANKFGRPSAYDWTVDNTTVHSATAEPVAVFTAKTSAADVAKALKGYKLPDKFTDTTYPINNTTKYTLKNGSFNTGDIITLVTKSGTQSARLIVGNAEGTETVASAISDELANGRLVEFYANDKNVIEAIVAVKYTTTEVTKVSTDKKTNDVSYTIDGATYKDYADEDTSDTIVLAGDVEKGDIVTYVKADNVAYVYPTTTFEGTQTATKTSDGVQTITVDGEKYVVGEAAKTDTSFSNSKDAANYYVDQYGFVVHTDSTATASTDYALVLNVNGFVEKSMDGTTPYLEARVLLADGTVSVYEVPMAKHKGDSKVWYIKGIDVDVFTEGEDNDTELTANAGTALLSKAFGYTLKDGAINLEEIAAFSDDTAAETVYTGTTEEAIAQGKTSYDMGNEKTALADKNTVFVVYNADKKTATLYTGSANLPKSINDEDKVGYVVLTTGSDEDIGTASVIFVSTAEGIGADTTDSYVYIDVTNYGEAMVDGENVFTYTGIAADGTEIELTSADKLDTVSGLYSYTEDNKVDEKIDADARFLDATVGEDGMTMTDTLLGIANKYYNITEDTSIVYVDSDLDEVNGNKGWVVLDSDDKSVVETIFVTAD